MSVPIFIVFNIFFYFKDSSVILENNMHLVELKSKNQMIESKIHEYEDRLKKSLNDQEQLIERIDSFKNIGKFK